MLHNFVHDTRMEQLSYFWHVFCTERVVRCVPVQVSDATSQSHRSAVDVHRDRIT